jgi:hypothetical protein
LLDKSSSSSKRDGRFEDEDDNEGREKTDRFIVPMRDFGIVEAPHEPSCATPETAL